MSNSTTTSAALSPTSQEFMSILERQLSAQENQMARQQQPSQQQQQQSQLFQQMQQMQQYQQMQQLQLQRQQQQQGRGGVVPQKQGQQQGGGMYGFDSFAQGQGQQLQQQQQQQQQGGNINSLPTTTTNPKDIPLTPEILNAFLQGLNSAGFSRQAISDFSAGQMGMIQGGQRQPVQQQQQQAGRGFTASPTSTQPSGGFVPSPQNGSDNNLMAMMMMMNNQIGGGNLIDNGNGLGGQQHVNLNPQNAYPQPGIHTPEASASSKDSVIGSNESSPEATTAVGGQGGMSSGQSPGESVNGGGQMISSRAGTTRQLSGSSSLGGGGGATSSSRRGSMAGQDRAGSMRAGADKGDHKRKAEEEELLGHQSLRRHMGEEDSLSEDNSDHPTQGNSKRSGKKDASSRRKSNAGAGAATSREDSDVQAKALKRKNQNRAAQKAFRERREQRVKDLEDKVAELEANNAGQTFENDNLRQLLSKLQKENMALKESKFTFAMPVPGSQSAEQPTASAGPSRSTSQGNTPTGMGVDKLPTPPLSTIEDRSKSARNPTPHSVRSNTASSQFDSPQSAFSGSDAISPVSRPDTSGGDQVFFNPEPYNAFTNAGAVSNPVGGYAPFASAAEQVGAIGNVDLQALLDAFKVQYGQTGQTPAPAPAEPSPAPPQFNSYREVNSEDLLGDALGNDFDFDANVSIEDLFGNDEGMNEFLKSLNQPDMFNSAAAVEDVLPLNKPLIASNGSVSPVDSSTETDPWAGFYGNTNELFKDNLNASTNLPRNDSNLSGSVRPGSASGASADAAFSPSKYFALSPDAIGTGSNDGISPPLVAGKTSPCPYGINMSSIGPSPQAYNAVTGERMLSTQEAWESVNHKIDLSNGFDLDDLCDSFKSKAQCNGAGPVISESEVNRIIDDYSKRKQMNLSS